MSKRVILIVSVLLGTSVFGQWAPEKSRISSGSANLLLESFWTAESQQDGKILLSGQLTIENLSDTAIRVGEVAIRAKGETQEALWPREISRLLKQPIPLDLTRTQLLERSITGQVVQPSDRASFVATFLVSRDLPSEVELLLGDLGTVRLVNVWPIKPLPPRL